MEKSGFVKPMNQLTRSAYLFPLGCTLFISEQVMDGNHVVLELNQLIDLISKTTASGGESENLRSRNLRPLKLVGEDQLFEKTTNGKVGSAVEAGEPAATKTGFPHDPSGTWKRINRVLGSSRQAARDLQERGSIQKSDRCQCRFRFRKEVNGSSILPMDFRSSGFGSLEREGRTGVQWRRFSI